MKSYKYFFVLIAAVFTIACSPNADINNSALSNEELDELIRESHVFTNELDFEGAFNKLNQLLNKSIEYENKHYEILAYLNIGSLYSVFNENEQALNYFLKSQKLAEEYNIDTYLNAIYNNLGIIYSENRFYILAEEYFKKALQLSQEKDVPEKIALNLINIATIKEEMNQLDSALFYSKQSLVILELNDITDLWSNSYNNIGQILFKENKFEEAKTKFKKAIELEYPNPDLSYIGIFELNLGKTHVMLNNIDSASTHLNEALIYLFKTNNSSLISECYYWLYKNEKSVKNSIKIDTYIDECLAWKDSVLFQKKEQWLLDVKMKYEFGKKETEIAYLEKQSALQNKIIISGTFISFIFIIFSISIWRSRNKNLKQRNIILNKEKEIAKIEVERNEAIRQKLEEDIENQKLLNRIKHEKIKLDLEHKNKEVVSKAIHLMNKNEILSSLYGLAKQLELDPNDKNSEIVDSMLNSIKNNLNQDSVWEDFKLHFDEVHESFAKALNQNHPDLSPTDIRLCAYLLIGLHSKEIASVSNISPESVRKRKQRLRSKLNLDSSIVIEDYLKSL